jgi:multisubunit Na+/H+ antiporter MnhG subunit
MAKTYAIVVGVVLLLVGLLGFVKPDGMMGLHFNTLHNTIHLVSGLLGVWAGFGKSASAPRIFAQAFGVIYTLVAIVGFAHTPGGISDLLMLNPMYNTIHLIVGLLGLAAGFMGGKQPGAA